MRLKSRFAAIAAASLFAASAAGAQSRPALGPVDGAELPQIDTGRVAVGTVAPDFTLETMDPGTVTLSQFRGKKNVLLVFYRGHW